MCRDEIAKYISVRRDGVAPLLQSCRCRTLSERCASHDRWPLRVHLVAKEILNPDPPKSVDSFVYELSCGSLIISQRVWREPAASQRILEEGVAVLALIFGKSETDLWQMDVAYSIAIQLSDFLTSA